MSENLHIAITGDNQGFINALNGARAGVRATAREVEQSGGSIEQMFSRIKIAATGALAGFSAKAFIQQVATIRGEFQQLEASFTTLLGSAEKAQSMMNDLTKLAATTPFGLQDVSQGAKQLLAYGVAAEDVTSTMRKLGDISAGLSLNLNDLVWLYGTTLTQGRMFTQDLRQFQSRGIPMAEELAKIFGVTKEQVAGLVTAGKVGSKEVIQAIDNMTKSGSQFGGLMDMQSHTITGQISNIEDTIDMAFNDLGKQSEGIINDALSLTSTLVEHWQEVGAAILYAAETIGLYKAASVAISRFQSNATNLGIDAEIAQYSAILPQKEAAANADLQQAVAEGKLTEAKAAKVAAMREEAQAYVVELQQKAEAAAATAKEAVDEYNAATSKAAAASLDLDSAEEKVEAMQHAYEAAVQSGEASAMQTAEENLNSAAVEKNIAAKNLQTARTEVSTAAKKVDSTAQAAQTAQTELNTAQTGLNTAATAADTTAKGLWAQVTALATRAQQAFNASMLASPLFWIAAIIAGVTFAIYELATADSAAEAAQKNVNNALDDFNKKLDERKQKAEELIHTIQSENATDFEKTEAYEQLSKLMPSITEKYTQAELAALDFGKAQKDIGSDIDTAKIEEAKNKVDELTEAIKNTKDAMADDARYNGGRGGLALANQLEEQQAELEQWENKVQEYENIVEQARQQAEEANKPIEVKLEEAQENYRVKQDIFDFYKEAMDLAEQLQAGNEEINYATGETKLDEFIAKAQADLADLRQQEAANPLDLNLRLKEEEKTKVLNGILDMKSQMDRQGTCIIPLWFQVDWNSLTKGVNDAKNKVAQLAQQKIDNNFGTQYKNKKKTRDDAYNRLQKINKNKSSYTVQEYQSAKKAYDDAEKDFTQNYGGASIKAQTAASHKAASAASKAANNAKNLQQQRDQAERDYKNKLKEYQKEREQLEQELAQSVIDVISDASEKELEQMRLNQEKEMKQLDDEQKQYVDKKTELEKAKAKANGTKYSGTTTLDADEQKMFDTMRSNLRKKHEQEDKEYFQKQADAMNDYLKEYGSFEQKRLAITEEYENKIKKATTKGDKLKLQKEKEQQLSSLSYKDISMGIDWSSLFSGIGSMTTDMMVQMQKKLQAYVKTDDYKNAGSQTQRDVVQLLQEMRQYIGTDKNTTWETLAKAMQDFSTAITRYQTARDNEKDAVNARDAAKKLRDRGEISDLAFQKYIIAANEAGEATEEARKNVEQLGNTLNQTSDEVTNFTSELTTALNNLKGWKGAEGFGEVQSTFGNVDQLKGALDSVLPTMADGAAKTLGDKMSTAIGSGLSSVGGGVTKLLGSGLGSVIGIVAQIPKLILQIASAIKNFVTGILDSFTELFKLRWIDDLVDSILGAVSNLINAIFDLPENIYKVLESIVAKGVGGLLNTVIGRIGNILSLGALSSKGPASWFTNSNAKEVEKTIDNLTEQNKNLEQSIEDLTDEMEKARGNSAINISRSAADLQQQTNENYKKIAEAQAGYHGSHHSWNYYFDGFNSEQIQRLSEQIGRAWGGDIWDLSPEEMKILRSNVDMWEQIQDTGKGNYGGRLAEKLNDYIEQAGKLEDITNQLYENLTTTTKDDVFDQFLNSLYDLADGSEDVFDDIANNWQQMVNKMVINNLVGERFQKTLESWYEDLAKLNESRTKGEITDDEYRKRLDELKGQYDSYVNSAKSDIETLRQEGIIKATDSNSTYSQNASSGSWQSMGEDTAQELNGRFTALQEAGERISDGIQTMVVTVNSLYGKVDDSNRTLAEMRNLMIIGNGYLEDILSANKSYYEKFDRHLDRIERTR